MLTRQVAGTLTHARSHGDEASVVITTPDLDLMSDRIDTNQMETASYLAGPASVNFGHDYKSRLPVARTLALNKNPSGIKAHFRWRGDAFSREVKSAFDDGVLGASVEFIPKEDPVRNEDGGFDFRKTILTGWAFTGNPANPRAIKLLKSLRHALGEDDLFLEVEDHGARFREEEKKMYRSRVKAVDSELFDVDLQEHRRLVEKAIRGACWRKHSVEKWDTPGWRTYREYQRAIQQSNRRSKRAQAEGYRRLQVWAEEAIKRSSDLAYCPLLPPPR